MGIRLRNILFFIAIPTAYYLDRKRIPPSLFVILSGLAAVMAFLFFWQCTEFREFYLFLGIFFLFLTGLMDQIRGELMELRNMRVVFLPFDIIITLGILILLINSKLTLTPHRFLDLVILSLFGIFLIGGIALVIFTSKTDERRIRRTDFWLEDQSERIALFLIVFIIWRFIIPSHSYLSPIKDYAALFLYSMTVLSIFLWGTVLNRERGIIISFFGILDKILSLIIIPLKLGRVVVEKLLSLDLSRVSVDLGKISKKLPQIGHKPKSQKIEPKEMEPVSTSAESQKTSDNISQLPKPEVEIIVRDNENQPIEDAEVTLELPPNFHEKGASNYEGCVTFKGLLIGTYSATIKASDFETEQVKIPVMDPVHTFKRIKLRSIQKTAPPTFLKIGVVDDLSNKPIEGAKVRLGRYSDITNSEGEVLFEGISAGKYSIEIVKELYNSVEEKCMVKAGEETTFEISLKPSVGLSLEQEEKISNAHKVLNNSFVEISASFDNCVPGYLKNVGVNLIELVTHISRTPSYFANAPDRHSEMVGSLIVVLESACKQISEGITKKKNIDIFSAIYREFGSGTEGKAGEIKRDEFVKELISNPDDFLFSKLPSTENKLSNIDNELTKRSKELSIAPLLELWSLSKDLLEESSSRSVVNRACTVLIADILLNYINEAFENNELMKRLKVSVL